MEKSKKPSNPVSTWPCLHYDTTGKLQTNAKAKRNRQDLRNGEIFKPFLTFLTSYLK
jgi:hypothetical protein